MVCELPHLSEDEQLDESALLQEFCNFLAKADKVLHKARQLPEGTADEWVTSLTNATVRFSEVLEKNATTWIKGVVDDKGANAAWNYVGTLANLPEVLKPFISILSQASFLEKLEVPEQSGDSSEIAKRTKTYVTLRSLKLASLSAIIPSYAEKVEKYTEAVSRNINKVINKLTGQLDETSGKLEDFRQRAVGFRQAQAGTTRSTGQKF